jgi:hypothetical protein
MYYYYNYSDLPVAVLPPIDYRMMCADLNKFILDRWDSQIRTMVGEWFGMRNIPVELFQISWRDGDFQFLHNNDTFTWSSPGGVLGCTEQRRVAPLCGGVQPNTLEGRRLSRYAIKRR